MDRKNIKLNNIIRHIIYMSLLNLFNRDRVILSKIAQNNASTHTLIISFFRSSIVADLLV